MCESSGLAEGFKHFAAEDAVIKRGNDSLIYGKEGIYQFYNQPAFASLRLSWAPDYIDVSSSGDLAYAYGKYVASRTDSSGTTTERSGIYTTVWRKQPDNTWRYVWD